MKISDVTVNDVANYLRLDYPETTEKAFIEAIMDSAKSYISSYTGIKVQADSVDDTSKTIDDYADFYIVFMVLCQDMYDTRSLYTDKSNVNKTVSCILDMHCTNLL